MQRIELAPAPCHAERRAHHRALWQELAARTKAAIAPAAAATRPGPGKWPVSRRLDALLDDGAPFLSLSALAGAEQEDCPDGAALVTGIGRISGVTCMVVANDWQHKGGTYRTATLQKHLRAQDIAANLRLPCVYLVDSGGIFLPEQAELFAGARHFGRMFANQARMSADGVAQIAVVLGMCTAGGAYVPAMADETIIVDKQATLFLAGPALVQAATGEQVTAEALGGAALHTRTSGVADHFAHDEADAFVLCREAVAALGPTTAGRQGEPLVAGTRAPVAPKEPIERLLDVLPVDLREPFPMLDVIACLVDDSAWHPFKADYGTALLCGFAALCGQPVGIVANAGLLDGAAAQKAAHFIQLCDQRQVPLLFLQHTTGFEVGQAAEAAGIAKEGAKMVQAAACARVPRITLIVGASHGAGNYAMCGRGLDPEFVFAWPNSRVSVMGPEQAANTLTDIRARAAAKQGRTMDAAQAAQLKEELMRAYARQSTPAFATGAGWDDGLLAPGDTRRALALALAACRSRGERPRGQPVVRH